MQEGRADEVPVIKARNDKEQGSVIGGNRWGLNKQLRTIQLLGWGGRPKGVWCEKAGRRAMSILEGKRRRDVHRRRWVWKT